MTTISIEEIQQDVIGYLRRVAAGETLLVLQADIPMAEIKPVETIGKQLRPFGLARGEFIVPDDFDSPLPEDVLNQFEGQ